MMGIKLVLVSVPFVLLSCGAGTGTGKHAAESAGVPVSVLSENPDSATVVPDLHESGDTAALAFVNGYVEYCNDPKSAKAVVEWVGSNPRATKGFKREVKRLIDNAAKNDPELGLGFDPLFDAQDYPEEGFELDSVDRQEGYVILRGKGWPGFGLAVKVVEDRGQWLVDGCGAVNIPEKMRHTK